MAGSDSDTLGAALRRFRTAAGLTQEELAERAGLSVRGISDLERGVNRTPYRATIQRLIEALDLSVAESQALEAGTNRRRGPAMSPIKRDATRLPIPPTALIGRDREEALALKLFRWEGRRLLTLTGPGGVGKTRLALQIAGSMASEFADGAVFVSLAAIRDRAQVLPAIAAVLGVRDPSGQSLQENLITFLQEREVLLLLDNFEQVLDAAPLVAEILAACPRVKALVTSRASLHLRGEQSVEVDPLAAPPQATACTLEELLCFPAVELFVQRAQLVHPDFEPSLENARLAAQICERVDGLPLAIELAAARLQMLSPQALLRRLNHRLSTLTGGTREVTARQQTMRSTIAWSHDLLQEQEQIVFRRLASFAGGCTMEAVEAVCADRDRTPNDAFDLLSSLIDRNLVLVHSPEVDEPRFSLLETIREFGQECLGPEAPAIRTRHAEYFTGLAERAAPNLQGPEQGHWLTLLDHEYDNLRAALAWSVEALHVELGLRLAGALWWFWYSRGYLSEGRRWLDELLNLDEAASHRVPPEVRVIALRAAGVLATEQGDYPRATTQIQEALHLAQQRDDRRSQASLLTVLGNIAKYQGRYEPAATLYSEALSIFRTLDDARSISVSLNNLANLAKEQSDYDLARSLYEESLTMRRRLGDQRGIAVVLNNIGTMAHATGAFERAIETGTESVELLRELGDKDLAAALDTLARAVLAQGDIARAGALYGEGFTVSRTAGERQLMAICLEGLGHVAAAHGNQERAAQFYGTAAALQRITGALPSQSEQTQNEVYFAAARQALGEERFTAAWQQGESMTPDQVLALDDAGPPPHHPD